MSDRDEDYSSALVQLHGKIAELAPAIAPRLDVDGRYNFSDGKMPKNLVLGDFVLVTRWVDLDTGRSHTDVDTNVRESSDRAGLLLTARHAQQFGRTL